MNKNKTTRRDFVKTTGSAVLGSTLAVNMFANPIRSNNILKVGLIGCGGRGSGAALQATKADNQIMLTAMADLFPDRLESALNNLKNENPEKVQVDKGHQFTGFDAYAKLLETDVDVVILATPPAFRPGHLEAAIEAGKHIFCEKPVAVDAPGIRRVIASAKKAKQKNLALMSGFCWRFDYRKRETFDRILDGAIGDVLSVHNTYNTGALWFRETKPNASPLEKTFRNWIYYNWLSGDHIVEQAIHSIDLMSWAMGDRLPVRATATGGRQSRLEEKYGNVYDHFAVVYEYENGEKGYHFCRQQEGCSRSYGVYMLGTKGKCDIDVGGKHQIVGKKTWDYKGDRNNMYQTEHDELFASIRAGKPFNDGITMAHSTMLGIWGRMAAYTGQTITWEEALNSNDHLCPELDEYSWDMNWPLREVAKPGITKFA